MTYIIIIRSPVCFSRVSTSTKDTVSTTHVPETYNWKRSHRCCNGWRGRIMSGRSWVRVKQNNYKIGNCCFTARQHKRVRTKTGWLEVSVMWPSGATCLPVDWFFFSELVLYIHVNPTTGVDLASIKQTLSSSHRMYLGLAMTAEKIAHLTLSSNHSWNLNLRSVI